MRCIGDHVYGAPRLRIALGPSTLFQTGEKGVAAAPAHRTQLDWFSYACARLPLFRQNFGAKQFHIHVRIQLSDVCEHGIDTGSLRQIRQSIVRK